MQNSNRFYWGRGLLIVAVSFVVTTCISLVVFPSAQAQTAQKGERKSLLELNFEIKDNQEQIDKLSEREEQYEESIAIRQEEAQSLENQISVLDNLIGRTQTQIERSELEIERLNLEIELIGQRIGQKEEEISDEKGALGTLIREIHRYDQKTFLEITMENARFSDFYEQAKYLEHIGSDTKDSVVSLRELKEQLEVQRTEIGEKRSQQERQRTQLEGEKRTLDGEFDHKQYLLEETEESEEQYTQLIDEIRGEMKSIDSEIAALSRQVQNYPPDEIIKLKEDLDMLHWPVSPDHGISAYFHDPTYPYRHIFEHPAIDVPVPQGTALEAAEDGIVLIAKNAGTGYSYILIAHTESITTVYGHVSALYVSEGDYVNRGDIVGLSGGQPGTSGAGRLTTGAHLHFEVRVDGIPVNPLNYLP